MGLEKAIYYGKEKRKAHRGAKSFCRSCRNHGGCKWCESNRKYSSRKRELAADDILHDFL